MSRHGVVSFFAWHSPVAGKQARCHPNRIGTDKGMQVEIIRSLDGENRMEGRERQG
jgi:hypothetical protein